MEPEGAGTQPSAPIGAVAADPERRYQGRIVAIFLNYQAALKWGAWDATYTPGPGAEDRGAPYYLIHAAAGSLLIGGTHAIVGASCPVSPPCVTPVQVLAPDCGHPAVIAGGPSGGEIPARPAKKPSAVRRRLPILGVGR